MPEFKYKSVSTTDGQIEKGVYTAKSKMEVIEMLRQKRLMPVWVEEVKGSKEITLPRILIKVKIKDLSIFCRQFYTMLNAGVSIIGCLDILSRQTENRKLQETLYKIYEEVQKGETLSDTLRKRKEIFPELLINMVEAGEVSGNLDVIMERMAVHFEKETKINNKIQSAMIYPIILSIIATGVVVFLLTFIMPTFVGMFEDSGVALPLPTQILLNISHALRAFWYLFLLILIGIVITVKRTAASEAGKFFMDNLKLRIPIVKEAMKKIMTSRFSRTLATLLSSGIPLIQAMDIVAKVVGNKVVEKGIKEAIEDVRKGVDLSAPIKRMGIFPPMLDSMIAIGEESGSLDEILDKTANFYDDEVDTAITKMTTLLEPLMIVIMAVVVGSIVIAMILPMFSMMNTLPI